MNKKRKVSVNYPGNKGFSLLETMLAVIAVMIAGLGIYAVFSSGLSNNNLNSASSEMVEVANVYTDLASADLTSDLDETSIVTTLQNTGRLSGNYFASSTTKDPDTGKDVTAETMVNKFGGLVFANVTAYGFDVTVPLGSTGNPGAQFCQQLKDMYSNCDDSSDDGGDSDSTGHQVVLTLDLTT